MAVFSVFTKARNAVNPNYTAPPTTTLDIRDCPDIYDLWPVTGSVSDDSDSVSYKLQSREKGDQNWITFAEGMGTSFSGELGLFDPTIRRNGIHDIRLFAEDAAGNPSVIVQPVILEGSLKANYANPVFDDGAGLPDGLSIPGQYDSRMQGSGDFGPGRTLPSSDVSVASTAILGEGRTQIMIPEYHRFSENESHKEAGRR